MSKQSNVDVEDKIVGLNKFLKPTKKISKKNEMRDNKIINKGGRPSKASQFEKERKKILHDMYSILGLCDTQKIVYLYDLDNDLEIQSKISELQNDVKLYFNYAAWPFFSKENTKRPYMSLIRSIIKEMNIKTQTINTILERNGQKMSSSGFILL